MPPKSEEMIASSPSISVTSELAPPPKVGGTVGAHADGIELQRRHAEVVVQLPQLEQLLDQRRDNLRWRADVGQGIGDHEGLHAGELIERRLGDVLFVEFLDLHAAAVGQRDRRRPEVGGHGEREIHLVLRRHRAFESHAIGLGHLIAMPVLYEVQPFLLGQRRFQITGPSDQAGLVLLAHTGLMNTEPHFSINALI